MTVMAEDYFVPYLVALRMVRRHFGLPEIAKSRELDELHEGGVQITLRQLVKERQIKARLLSDIYGQPRELGRDVEHFKLGWLGAHWQDSEWHQGDLERHFGPAEQAKTNEVEWPWMSQTLPEGFVFNTFAIDRLGKNKELLRFLRLRMIRGFYFEAGNRTQTAPLPWDIWFSTHAKPILKTGIVWTPSEFLRIPIYLPLVFKERDIAMAVCHAPTATDEPAWVTGPATHEVSNRSSSAGAPRKWDWENAIIGLVKYIEDGGNTKQPMLVKYMAQWFIDNQNLDGHPDLKEIRGRVKQVRCAMGIKDD